jgi:hypothetical protein
MRVVVLRDEWIFSFLGAGLSRAFHFERDYSLIVELLSARRVIFGCLKQSLYEVIGAEAPILLYYLLDTSTSKENALRTGRVEQAIAKEDKYIARRRAIGDLLMFHAIE